MIKKDLEVQNYETNLKMHYEAKRKELDILLTSSIVADNIKRTQKTI